MPDRSGALQSSRGRYVDYRKKVHERRSKKDEDGKASDAPADAGPHGGEKSKKRSRPFFTLLREFWGLLPGHRGTLAAALVTLAVSTLLGLVPLYGSKLVVDNVLGGKPLPPQLQSRGLPSDPRRSEERRVGKECRSRWSP